MRGLAEAAVAGVVGGLLVAGAVTAARTLADHPAPLPVNTLHCTAFPPGWLYVYRHAGGQTAQVTGSPFHIAGGRACQWAWPSEWTAAGGTRTWTNPPATFTLVTGQRITEPGDAEYLVSAVRLPSRDTA